MLYMLKCGDVSGDANNVTNEIIIEMDGESKEFYLALRIFAKEYGVDIRDECQIDNRIEKTKIEKIYNVLGLHINLDDINSRTKHYEHYKILVDEYFELMINIVMFINPSLNIKIKKVESIEFSTCGLTSWDF